MTSTRLGDVVTVKSGFAFKSADWLDAGVPVIKIANVKDGWVTLDGCSFVSEEVAHSARAFELTKGDVLISMTGHIGQVAKVRDEGRMLLNQRVGRFSIKNRERIDGEYLFQWLRLPEVRAVFEAHAYGAAQPNISPTLIEQQSIPLPPLPVQLRIASILSAYDDLIENNSRRIAILEEMSRRLYEEWFVRFRFPGHEGVRMVESELGLVPEGWSLKTLQDIATVTMGLSPKGETYNEDADGTPLINGPVEFGERFTKRVKWTTAPTKLCQDGDLVVCVRGSTTGKYVKSDGVYCLGRGVCAIRGEYQGFVDQVFAHQLPILLGQVGGSTFPSWTGPQLKLHPVLVPTSKLLRRFEAHAGPLRDAVGAYSRQIENLRVTRDLLLPKLISGELDVSALPEPQALAA